MPTPLPTVTRQQNKQALPRVQTEALLPIVQTEAIALRVPETAQEEGKRATRSTSKLPVATEQQTPTRRKQTNTPQVNVDNTKKTPTRSAMAQLKAQNAPPSARTRSKTMGIAKAANKRFARMENEVQQMLAVMDK
jgi:hypothetical protein